MTARRLTMAGAQLLVAATLLTMTALPAAGGTAAARGAFAPFADGPTLGYDAVEGTAVLVRTGSQTVVSIQVAGLSPGASHPAHVHDRPCDDGAARGHYRFAHPVPGGAFDGTEIWPGPLTANATGHAQGQTVVGAVAGPDAVSVVVHAPSGEKIACADLR